ncbi:hypothetical protein J6590_036858 [Homalodisca vitripennis]|nr:hypothetical protein J6590_036858 [Homalodisca vitripennis]
MSQHTKSDRHITKYPSSTLQQRYLAPSDLCTSRVCSGAPPRTTPSINNSRGGEAARRVVRRGMDRWDAGRQGRGHGQSVHGSRADSLQLSVAPLLLEHEALPTLTSPPPCCSDRVRVPKLVNIKCPMVRALQCCPVKCTSEVPLSG